MADKLAGIGRFNKIDPEFTPVKPSAEVLRIAALNAAPGQTAKQYLESRGGVNAAGYYGDSWSAATNLTDKEYFAAIEAAKAAGKTGAEIGEAINAATAAKLGLSLYEYTGGFQGTPTGSKTTVNSNVSKTVVSTYVDSSTGDVIAVYSNGTTSVLSKGTKLAEMEAEKQATRTKAKDKLTAMLAAWNLEGLAAWLDKQIMGDVSEEMILLGLYEQPEYQKRFPGMEALRKAGRTVTEAEYIDIENKMIQTARFFDLPKGFYDGPEDFGDLIGKQVSAKEYQDRLQVGQDLARSLNPSVKQQLIDFYGVGEGDLTAYVLDADRALPLIQKQAKAAMFVGLGRAAGFSLGGITAQQAESIAGTESYAKLSEAQLKQALEGAGQLRRTQQRLSQIEGMTYNEQEALSAVIESSPEALLASQQRAQREVARFGARGGITAGSLRGTETAI